MDIISTTTEITKQDNKDLHDNPTNFLQNSVNKKTIATLSKYFEELIDNLSVNNISSTKINTAKLETETKMSNNIEDIQADNIKTMNTFEIKISSITSRQPSSSNQKHIDQLKWPLLKTTDKFSNASHFTFIYIPNDSRR